MASRSLVQEGNNEISMSDFEKIRCLSCDSLDCDLYYDVKYKGMRATCKLCGANWPES